MDTNTERRWQRFRELHFHDADLELSLDVSRMTDDVDFPASRIPGLERALREMEALEGGAIANPDEGRMVGHYWLRAPDLAPDQRTGGMVKETIARVEDFARAVQAGEISPPGGGRFQNVLSLGIGGSALGPQLVARALASPVAPLSLFFLDNTDPDGFDRVLDDLGEGLDRTMVLVISKSGGTAETRNAASEVRRVFERRELDFARHAVAITGAGSKLEKMAENEGWLARFPMWDWVGGRTSVLSAVGLLPAALQGIPIREMLAGASQMDVLTRREKVSDNPAAQLAAAWHHASGGRGEKAMVVLPYKDRLDLLARYLQQLVMESLGKRCDLEGNDVHQGLTVYGNKGSTDQHAFIQQLREGTPDFFVSFIEVLKDRDGEPLEVEPGVTSGDYLSGFLLGTRAALSEAGRPSLTITIGDVVPRTVGALIALFERAVGLYASLIRVNAYHQPGVEAGKQAAARLLELQGRVLTELQAAGEALPVEALSARADADPEEVFLVLRHLVANRDELVVEGDPGQPFTRRYRLKE